MPTNKPKGQSKPDETLEKKKQDKPQSSPAQRALEEAAIRRKNLADNTVVQEEIGGRGGLDPSRYGDWEVKGVISDF